MVPVFPMLVDINKNFKISINNLFRIIKNQKDAAKKISIANKLAAEHPKDTNLQNKILEATILYDVITKQRNDAEEQRIKIEHEKTMTMTKARELSVETAKARAGAITAYSSFNQWGYKFCTTCKTGVKKIAERRKEAER